MRRSTVRSLLIVLLVLAAAAGPTHAELSERWQKMNQPVEPFRILGNLYYVGANSVTSFLITTPDGHILIDGGFEETVPQIEANIAKLGFELEDVEILLNSHAHFDHAGGLARLKKASGARFMASEIEAPILERGGLGDDLLGDEAPFPKIEVDRMLKDGETIEHGGMRLTAHVTAGHTRGCTSWAFEVEDAGESHLAVSICSLSVLDGMKFGEDPTYPTIARDFGRSFETLEALPCEVFLASHAGFFRMKEKQEKLGEEGPNPFIDRKGYLKYIDRARERFKEAVAKEQAGGDGSGGSSRSS
ncbi:MAG: subclass B3 metallo-beta-lactamase [bacterium]|nr:subclass B3 metallo-beta-lactamase [bacterium]